MFDYLIFLNKFMSVDMLVFLVSVIFWLKT